MTHVITGSCCNDTGCVQVWPVDYIHPSPDDPGFLTTEMLYIGPDSCIDYGSCVAECPVDAIIPDDEPTPSDEAYRHINADYYDGYVPSLGWVPNKLDAGLVIRAVSYSGAPVPGLPFHHATSVVPNVRGRVVDGAGASRQHGAYIAGRIKRGASGGIGRNRVCGQETAATIVDDSVAGLLDKPIAPDARGMAALLAACGTERFDVGGGANIDAWERAEGAAQGRSRLKIVTMSALRKTARRGCSTRCQRATPIPHAGHPKTQQVPQLPPHPKEEK